MKCKFLLCAAAALLLTACGEDISAPNSSAAGTPASSAVDSPADSSASDSADENSAPSAAGVSYTYTTGSGVTIAINAESDPIVAQLGTPNETFEAPSCAFEGISYTYNYGTFMLETYPGPTDGTNRVYAVTLTDASLQTAEGISVGMTPEEVRIACGEPDAETAAYMMYQTTGIALQFFFENDTLMSIVYTFQN